MELPFSDVSIDALRLNLFRGSFNKEELLVVKNKEFKIKDYDVELAIIGASHFISFKKGKDLIFSEVFACVDIAGANQYIGDELKEVKTKVFDYEFKSYIFNIDKGKEIIQRFQDENILIFEFGMSKEMKESAITALIFKEKDGKIELETIHVYPNENRAIVTNSFFNLS